MWWFKWSSVSFGIFEMGFGELTASTIWAAGCLASCWHNQHGKPIRIDLLLWVSGYHFWSKYQNFCICWKFELFNHLFLWLRTQLFQVMPNNYIASITLYCNTSFPTILPYNSCGKAYMSKYLYNRCNSQGSCNDTTAAWHEPSYEIPSCKSNRNNNNTNSSKHTNAVSG